MTDPVRLIEPGATIFSAAEIRVAVIPVGDVPDDVMGSFAGLITACRQVELANVRSFFNQAQKSPFNSFPWKTGTMHFHYVPQEVALEHNPLTALSAHKKVLGVIGLCFCPTVSDLTAAYASFEQQCRQFPDAMTMRCFAFEPSEEQALMDVTAMPHLMLFPPGDAAVLDSHTEVMMHDLAAALLGQLEHVMLTCTAAAVDLSTALDSSPDFQTASGAASAMEAVSSRLYNDEETLKKRRIGRQQKAMGDYCLLAGSPIDACSHYHTAADLAKASTDFVWAGAALEGLAHSKVLVAAVATGVLRGGNGPGGSAVAPSDGQPSVPLLQDPRLATVRSHNVGEGPATSAPPSCGFGGRSFWAALARAGIESEVGQLFLEAKAFYRRRSCVPLLVEADLKLARFLAGLDSRKHRREVSALVTSMVEAGHSLSHPADHLAAVLEASQVMGAVGCARKRTLMLWQAVEISRRGDAHDDAALDIARRALEPPPDAQAFPAADAMTRQRAPLSSGVPRHWPLVRCGCIEGVLATAILANQHSDVWDAAATLLREHWRQLSSDRQSTLLETLAAAASQMKESHKRRPGAGPPPLVSFRRPLPPPPHLHPRPIDFSTKPLVGAAKGPFIFSALDGRKVVAAKDDPVTWVAGESAAVEVDISNPTTVPIKVEKLTLEASHVADPAAQGAQEGTHSGVASSAWKPSAVALWMPPGTKPTKVLLQAAPLQQGVFHLSGCRTTVLAVTWSQPWSARTLSLGAELGVTRRGAARAAAASPIASQVRVVPPLPLVMASIDTPDCILVPSPPTLPQGGNSSQASSSGGISGNNKRGDDIFAAPSLLTVRAARGQLLSWQLRVSNPGRFPVAAMRVSLHVSPSKSSTSGRAALAAAASVRVEVDDAAVAAALPLMPGSSASIQLHLHPAQVVSVGGVVDEVAVEVRVEYAAKDPHPSSADSDATSAVDGSPSGRCQDNDENSNNGNSNDNNNNNTNSSSSRAGSSSAALPPPQLPTSSGATAASGGSGRGGREERGVLLGRRLLLPVRLLLDRSLQVSTVNVAVRDVVEDSDSNADTVTRHYVRGPSTSCLLEVDAVSHLDGPVEVWLGRRHVTEPAGSLATWHTWAQFADERGARLLLPGRRAWVHLMLPTPLLPRGASSAAAAASSFYGGLPTSSVAVTATVPSHSVAAGGGAGAEAALLPPAAVADHAALYWRRTSGGGENSGVGVVPLPVDLVAAALTESTLALLAPSLLALSLSLAPATPKGEWVDGPPEHAGGDEEQARASPHLALAQQLQGHHQQQKQQQAGGQKQLVLEDNPLHEGDQQLHEQQQQQQARGEDQLRQVQWQAGGQAPDGKLQPEQWAASVAVGQPLRLSLHLANHGTSRAELLASVCSASSDGSGGGSGGAESAASPSANTTARVPTLHPSLLTAGIFSGVYLAAEGKGGVGSHSIGVCFLAPGLYVLQPFHLGVVGHVASGKPDVRRAASAVSVSSLYVLVQ